MSNPYFLSADVFRAHTVARSSQITAEFKRVESAFDQIHADLNDWSTASSTSTLTVGTGFKALVISAGRFIQVGQVLTIAAVLNTDAFMTGRVTSYDHETGAAVVNVAEIGAAGTHSNWTVAISTLATLPGDLVTATGAVTLSGKTMNFGANTFQMTLAQLNAAIIDNDVATPADVLSAKGIKARQMGAITASLLLVRAEHAGVYIVAAASGITLTFPAGNDNSGGFAVGEGVAVTNSSGADITLAFPGGSDTVSTTLKAGQNAFYYSDGNGYWRESGRSSRTFLDQSMQLNPAGTIHPESIGYRGLPANNRTANYTLQANDAGKLIPNTTGGWVVPANASVAFPIGTTVVLFNNSGSAQSLSVLSDTLRLGGTTDTGPRSVDAYGLATIVKVAATAWVVTGHVT